MIFVTLTGRYDKISRCDRICPVCSLDIEDEIHFLFDCTKYSSIRDGFFNKIAKRIPNYKHIQISTLITQLMNSTDYYLNKQLVQQIVFIVTNKKITIQCKKLRNCDVKEYKDIRHLSKFQACAFPQTPDIRRYISQKFTEPSMKTPYWCTSVVHQYGGRKTA